MVANPITRCHKGFAISDQDMSSWTGRKSHDKNTEEISSPSGIDAKDKTATDMKQEAKSISKARKNLETVHKIDLHFSIHSASGNVMVIVTDGNTGKVIREIPPSEILDLSARLEEMIGLVYDQKA